MLLISKSENYKVFMENFFVIDKRHLISYGSIRCTVVNIKTWQTTNHLLTEL